jgi:hypothetical protein
LLLRHFLPRRRRFLPPWSLPQRPCRVPPQEFTDAVPQGHGSADATARPVAWWPPTKRQLVRCPSLHGWRAAPSPHLLRHTRTRHRPVFERSRPSSSWPATRLQLATQFELSCQSFVSFRNLQAMCAIRVVLGQRSSPIPPRLGPLTVNHRIPRIGHSLPPPRVCRSIRIER